MSTQLTEKEIEIVQRIADGERPPKIAENMRLNYDYTKHLISRIRAKMQCETTHNMIATAIRQGLID